MGGNYSSVSKKSKHAPTSSATQMSRNATNTSNVGNMALGAAMGDSRKTGRNIDELGTRIRQRMQGVQERSQSQIPRAENEADRLSSAVNAGTPESVKAVMGKRMGADFSGVRFHTGAAAAAKADSMGARAYTSGADVYFGSGGFDASVAAHELVHTAQQGMVDSQASVMSTPVGGVQMVPNPFKWLWNKTGGRAIRKQHDAMIELHEAMKDNDWKALSTAERLKWKAKNPVAYNRYMHSETAKKETAARIQKRENEKKAAEEFLKDPKSKLGASSMLDGNLGIGTRKTDAAGAPEGMTLGGAVDKAGDIAGKVDNLMIPPGVASAMQEAKWISQAGQNGLGGFVGGMGIATGAVGSLKSIHDIGKAFTNGGKMDKLDAIADLSGNVGKMGGGAAAIAKAAGHEIAGKVGGGFDVLTGGIDMYKGSRQIHQGRMKHNAMEAFQKDISKNKKRDELEAEDRLLMDIATQGKMEGTRQKIKGSGKLITGAADAASGIAELSGAGAGVGAGIKMGNAVVKAGFAAANKGQKNRMVNKVVEQTSGLTEERIRAFQQQAKIKSYSRAKQALMKSMGYETGTRAELYADQTEKRGQYLAKNANSATADPKFAKIVTGLGVKKKKSTGSAMEYSADDITKSLGHWKDRSAIAKGHNTIKKAAAKRKLKPSGTP